MGCGLGSPRMALPRSLSDCATRLSSLLKRTISCLGVGLGVGVGAGVGVGFGFGFGFAFGFGLGVRD